MAEVFDFGLQQHKIKMDGKFFENNLFAVAGDTGRRLEVQLLDSDNMIQNTTGISLRLNANVAGQATYAEATLVDATKGLYELDLPNGMLIAPGNWQFQWQIIGASGEKLHSFAFMGSIGSNLAEGATEAFNFYLNLQDLKQMQEDFISGAFDSALLETNIAEKLTDLETQYAPKLTEVTAQLAQTVDTTRVTQNNPTNFKGGMITFVDDDASWLHPTWWDSILSAKNINITLAAISGKVGTGGYMTLQQLKDSESQGNDVVSHGVTTQDFGSLTAEEAEVELKDSQQWLKDNGFKGYDTFVYPGGLLSTNVTLKNVTRKYYKYGIATWDADSVFVNTMPVDNWAIKRIFLETNTLDQLKDAADSANLKNQWLVVLSHAADFTQTHVDKLISFIDYVQAQNIPIKKFSEAVKYKGNAVALGEHTDASSTFIGVDGSIKSPIKEKMSINSTTSSNIMDASINTYDKDKITIKVLDGDTDTLIGNGGAMHVFRSSNSDVYSYALFYPYETNRIYSRRWNMGEDTWKTWELFTSTKVLSTPERQALSPALLTIAEECFDTTLSKPLWVKSIYPSVWVDAMGTVVS